MIFSPVFLSQLALDKRLFEQVKNIYQTEIGKMKCCACDGKIDTVKGNISYLLSCVSPYCLKPEQWDMFAITMKLTGKNFPDTVRYLSELSHRDPIPASVPEKKRMKEVVSSMFQKEKDKKSKLEVRVQCEI